MQIFSLGLSLPTDTGRGLSEHGDASRDTVSESSSLKGLPDDLTLGIYIRFFVNFMIVKNKVKDSQRYSMLIKDSQWL